MTGPENPTISVIIPVWNEVQLLRPLVERLRAIDSPDSFDHLNPDMPETISTETDRTEITMRDMTGTEIIIADCGSDDGTLESVAGLATIISSSRGRAIQMNRGAAAARGDILWFLHADCLPPEDSFRLIRTAMTDPDVVAGGFRWDLNGSRWYYPLATGLAHWKNRLRKNLFGDMGIFVRRTVFEDIGGYREIRAFEDVELANRLRRSGRIVILAAKLPSSDRKLVAEGPMRAFIWNDILKILYGLGVSPERLARMYRARADSEMSAADCAQCSTDKAEEEK